MARLRSCIAAVTHRKATPPSLIAPDLGLSHMRHRRIMVPERDVSEPSEAMAATTVLLTTAACHTLTEEHTFQGGERSTRSIPPPAGSSTRPAVENPTGQEGKNHVSVNVTPLYTKYTRRKRGECDLEYSSLPSNLADTLSMYLPK
ncbi:hypothetical protein F5Y05DRAFT_410563 [Hypoxylon sp. FL0543]|nr:hypothetical protein F5Y05DRAFT_410563 [Hypoxylon sp. FL0543]